MRTIGNQSFTRCTALPSLALPDTVTSLGVQCFFGATSLREVTIGTGLNSMGVYAFGKCSALKDVVFRPCDTAQLAIAESAFRECAKLESVSLSRAVTSIGAHAFKSCSALKRIDIPDSVTSIGSGAFTWCSSLGEIALGDGLATIGGYSYTSTDTDSSNSYEQYGAFAGCVSLTNIVFGSSLRAIGNQSFTRCTALPSLALPDTVTSLGVQCFFGATSLRDVSIGTGLKSMGESAFGKCASLKSVVFRPCDTPQLAIAQSAFRECTKLESAEFSDAVTSIGVDAFKNCLVLKRVVIPDSVTIISSGAFTWCSSLGEIVLGDGLTTIGGYSYTSTDTDSSNSYEQYGAFAGCVSLTNIVFGSSLRAIGNQSFTRCTALPSLALPDTVTSLGVQCFFGATSLRDVSIGTGLKSMGESAFGKCASLKSVVFRPCDTPQLAIAQSAFRECTKLESAEFSDAVTSIGVDAFKNCLVLKRVVIPDSVTIISSGAFTWCSSLGEIVLGDGLTTIGGYSYTSTDTDSSNSYEQYGAFAGCVSLTNIVFGSSLRAIGNQSFTRCAVSRLVFPNTVTSIGVQCFYGASLLGSVTFGNRVASIGSYAFGNCPCLRYLHFLGDPPTTVGNNVFNKMKTAAIIYREDENTEWPETWRGYAVKPASEITMDADAPYDLAFYQPDDWPATFFLSDETNSLEICTRFLAGNPIYASFAAKDLWGDVDITGNFTNTLYISGVENVSLSWKDKDGLPVGWWVYWRTRIFRTLQNLSPGEYTATWVLNEPRSIRETNYANNSNSVTFVVVPSTLISFMSEDNIVATEYFEKGGTYRTLPVAPLRQYYNFAGWFTEADGGNMVTTTSIVPDSPATLYAHWEIRPAQTNYVSGTVSANATWRTGDLYVVRDNLTIANGATVTIEPGVIVKFAAGKSLKVNSGGTLKVNGTRALPVVFTSIKDDANGGDTNGDGDKSVPNAGDWHQLCNYGTVNIEHAKLLYCSAGNNQGALYPCAGTMRFKNSTVAHCQYDCMRGVGGTFIAENSVFTDASMGAAPQSGKSTFVNCVFYSLTTAVRWGYGTFLNCTFTDIAQDIIDTKFYSSTLASKFSHCCFWNPEGTGDHAAAKVGKDGNIWANPLFVNPDNGDFRIAANSPCVDAGDGTVAPEKDYYGLERRDVGKVTDSGVPSANGNCPDIGIHEVLWDEDESPYDIAPTAVSIDKTTAKIGDTVKVSWTIQNLGTEDVVGGWHDAVSLVSASGQNVELGEVVTTYPLKRKMSMNVNGTFTIPALPEGTWYARVNTNNRRSDVPEGLNTTNNVLTSAQGIAISVAATPYANGATGKLSVGSCTVVKFTFPSGTTGQIARVSVPVGLSVSYGLGFMPQGTYASGTMTATEKGEAMFHVPAGTTEVYLVMDAAQSGGQNYSVSFEKGDLAITSVSPNTVPSSGSVSITINGAGFDQNTTVSFVSGSSVVAAQNVRYVSAEQLVATFNGSEWTGGNTVLLRLNGGTAEFANAFTVANTQGSADLVAKLILPDSIRERRIVTGWIEVENQGNVDAELPFYFISSTGGYEFNYAGFEAGWRDNLFIVAVDSNERVVVGAGEKYRIPFFVRAISQKVGDCILSELDESKSLNIETVCDQMNWDVSDNNLMMNVARLCGSTWLDFASNVRRYLRNHPIGAYYSGSVEKISADYLRYNSMGVPIIGRVFDNNGSVIANCQDVMLCMESEDTKSVVIARAHTDANGFYYFPGLSNGVYSVEIPTYTLLENCLRLSGNGMVHDVFANEGNVAEVRGSVSRSDFFDSTNMVVFAINEHLGYYREIQITNNEFLAIFPALCNGEWRFGLSLNNSTLCETFTNIFEQKSVVPLPEVEFLTVRGRLLENSNVVSDYTVSCASMVGAPVVSADGSFSFVMLKQTNDVDETIFFNRNNMQYAQKTFSINANELEQNLGEIVVPTMVHVKGHIYEIDDTPIGDELITICDSNGFSRVVSLTNAGMLDVFLKEGTYFIAFDEAYEVAVIQVSAGMDNIEVRRQPINRQTVTTVRDSNRVVRLKATGEDLSNAPISELRTTESFLFTLACAFPSDPQALLRFYLGDDGAEVRKLQKGFTRNRPWEFGPNSSLSQEAKTTDDSWYKKTYKDIKGSIYGFLQGHCSFDSCSLSNGEKPNLNDGFRMDFNPKAGVKDVYSEIKAGRKKLFLSFGGMNGNAGDIYLEILSVIRTESDDGCSATYNFDVIYHGKDEYDFATHRLSVPVPELVQLPSGEMFYTVKHVTFRLGVLEAANPPWALSFWTELQIQDHFEVTITKEKPKPPTEEKDRKRPKVPQSCDPNEMVGPDGTGEARYVQPGEWMNYTIYFENKTNATAAAQEVYVTNPLSEWLDWSTFEMGDVSFNNQIDIGLSGLNGGASEVQMNGTNYAVRTVLGGGNDGEGVIATSGVAHWYMRIVDNSDETTWPADPYAGFLPPNDPDTHCGEGHISYRIKVRDDAPRNVIITNSATIVFDYNAPIETDPAWWNTVARIHDVEVEIDGVETNLTLIAGQPFGALPAPKTTRTGYTFDAWYTGPNGTGTKATPTAIVPTGDFSLYQNWVGVPYKVRFNANGGTGTMSDQAFEYGTAQKLAVNAFTRKMHAFAGWALSPDGEAVYADGQSVENLAAKANEVVTLYAVWEKTMNELWPSGVDGAVPMTAASVYDGYLRTGDGAVVGTIQVKVGKPNKDNLASVKATVIGLDGKKKSLKAAEKGKTPIAADGPSEVELVGGEACTVTLGAKGMSGRYGAYFIDGGLNVFMSKAADDKATASAALGKWQGAVNVAWQLAGDGSPYQTLTVTIANKGKAKATGTLADGTRVTASSQLVVGEDWCCVPVVEPKKAKIAFNLWLSKTGGIAAITGLADAIVGKPGTLKGGAKFRIDAAAFSATWGQAALPYLPNGVPVTVNGAKWTLPKAGKVAYLRGTTDVDAAKLLENPSALKLTYTAKTGAFKGSFKAYAEVNGKPKATTVNVTGVLVDGVGYGAATIKKVGGVSIKIGRQ